MMSEPSKVSHRIDDYNTYYCETSVVASYPKPGASIDASTLCKSKAHTAKSPHALQQR
jgi:hypothetical protein